MPRPAGRARRPVHVAAIAAVVVMVVVVGPLARPAAAHATLLETSPADDTLLDEAPDEVSLRFDEPVEVSDDAVRVVDPNGDRVDAGSVESREDSAVVAMAIDAGAGGTYTVAWRVLSEDSHNLSGSFIFHVGERTGAVAIDNGDDSVVDGVAGVARWLALAATIVVLGGSMVAALATGEEAVGRRLRWLVVGAAGVGVVAVALLLVTHVAETRGRSLGGAVGLVWDQALETRTGVLWTWRLGFLAVAGVVAAVPSVWRRAPLAPAVAALGAVAVTSASGHAWTADWRAVAVGSDVVHFGAVGLWIGGLVALSVALRRATDARAIVGRFSFAALVCAAVVGVTGLISAVLQVPTWDALTGTGYGQLVLVKVAGFAVLVGFGWWNRAQLIPRLAQALGALLRSVHAEVVVAGAVLVVAAVLIQQPPARATGVASGPYDETVEGDELTVQLQVVPARVGTNDLHLYFYEPGTAEAATVDAVEMTGGVGDIPPRRLEITPITPTHVSALAATLTTPGTWTFEVTAVHEGVPTTITFEVPIT